MSPEPHCEISTMDRHCEGWIVVTDDHCRASHRCAWTCVGTGRPGPSFAQSQPKFDTFVATLPSDVPVIVQNHSIDAFNFSSIVRYTDDTDIYFVRS